jgi:L-arabinose isomerase-like protein
MDLSNRFRLLVNEVDVVKSAQPLPKLPVARGRVGVPALLQDCLRGMDLCRRGTPHRFQLRGHHDSTWKTLRKSQA